MPISLQANPERDANGGSARVASNSTLSASVMPACIAACAKQAPGIRFMLFDRRIQEDVLNSVRRGEVDFGMVIDPSPADDLHCETILSDTLVLVTPPDHRFARQENVRWAALSGARLVLLDHASGSRRLIDEALARYGAACKVMQEVGYPTTVFSMVEAGIGISIMPALSLPPAGSSTLAASLLIPSVRPAVTMIRRRNWPLSPPAERVWALVRQTVAGESL
jgi:DNA-binding transcriptional LysR family regulator